MRAPAAVAQEHAADEHLQAAGRVRRPRGAAAAPGRRRLGAVVGHAAVLVAVGALVREVRARAHRARDLRQPEVDAVVQDLVDGRRRRAVEEVALAAGVLRPAVGARGPLGRDAGQHVVLEDHALAAAHVLGHLRPARAVGVPQVVVVHAADRADRRVGDAVRQHAPRDGRVLVAALDEVHDGLAPGPVVDEALPGPVAPPVDGPRALLLLVLLVLLFLLEPVDLPRQRLLLREQRLEQGVLGLAAELVGVHDFDDVLLRVVAARPPAGQRHGRGERRRRAVDVQLRRRLPGRGRRRQEADLLRVLLLVDLGAHRRRRVVVVAEDLDDVHSGSLSGVRSEFGAETRGARLEGFEGRGCLPRGLGEGPGG